ncbi:MAG TPA: hypothetical protein VEY30_00440, partial [Myxococcaceae bacterium]|nr:hypothetical protein [Myxococcaceae bacterium]
MQSLKHEMKNGARLAPWALAAALALSGCEGAPAQEDAEVSEAMSEESELQANPLPAESRLKTRWERQFPDVQLRQVAIEASGNRVVTLEYSGPTSFGGVDLPYAGTGTKLGVAKLGPDGSVVWVKGFGARYGEGFSASATAHALAVNAQGDIFLGGSLSQTGGSDAMWIGGCRVTNGAFLARLFSDGSCSWARNTQPEPGEYFEFVDFAADSQGGFVALARFPVIIFTSPMMVVSYDADGNPRWTKTFFQEANVANGVEGNAVAVDQFDRPYVVGGLAGTVTLGNRTHTVADDPNVEGASTAPLAVAFERNGDIRWSKLLADSGSATAVSTREGHLMVGLQGKLDEGLAGYLVSLDLSANTRWVRKVGSGAPITAELGADKEVTVVAPTGNGTYAVSQWNRVNGRRLGLRPLEPKYGFITDVAVSVQDGSSTLVGFLQGPTD